MNPFNRFRLFHALFVSVFLAAYLSGDDGDLPHIWLGYGLIVVVVVRLLLALIRVKGFPAPWSAFRSGAMAVTVSRLLVITLLLSASVTVATGLTMVDNARVLGLATARTIAPAHAEEEAWGESDSVMGVSASEVIEEIHEVAANATLGLAGLHLAFLLAFRHRFALNMIPGFGTTAKKRTGLAPEAASASGASSA